MQLTINEEQRQEIEAGLLLQRKALEKNKKSNEDIGNRAGMLEDERRLRILNGGPGEERGLLEMVYRESKDQGPLFNGKDGDGVSVRESQSVDEALDDPDYQKPQLVKDEPEGAEDGSPEAGEDRSTPFDDELEDAPLPWEQCSHSTCLLQDGHDGDHSDISPVVMRRIEEELEKDRDASLEDLREIAVGIEPAIDELTRRQFNAKYVLQVKRRWAAGRRQPPSTSHDAESSGPAAEEQSGETETSLTDLGINPSLYATLKHNGITTLEQLRAQRDVVPEMNGIGDVSLKVIDELLEAEPEAMPV